MTRESGLFRQEALAAHARQSLEGRLLQGPPRWVEVTFWGVALALALAGAALARLALDADAGPAFLPRAGTPEPLSPPPATCPLP